MDVHGTLNSPLSDVNTKDSGKMDRLYLPLHAGTASQPLACATSAPPMRTHLGEMRLSAGRVQRAALKSVDDELAAALSFPAGLTLPVMVYQVLFDIFKVDPIINQ